MIIILGVMALLMDILHACDVVSADVSHTGNKLIMAILLLILLKQSATLSMPLRWKVLYFFVICTFLHVTYFV